MEWMSGMGTIEKWGVRYEEQSYYHPERGVGAMGALYLVHWPTTCQQQHTRYKRMLEEHEMNNEIAKIIKESKLVARALGFKKIQNFIAKFPDAEWGVNAYVYSDYDKEVDVRGNIWIGNVNRDEYDLTDIATEADQRTMDVSIELADENFIYDGLTINVRVKLRAYQELTEDEKQTLRDIGKLQTIEEPATKREVLLCS